MTTSDRRWTAALAVLLVGMTAALFWPVRTFEFVRYDDPYYVVDNHRVSGGLSLSHAAWAFSNGLSGSWQPLTWLSLMLDAEIGGPDARVFHLSNLAIHTLNVVLVFLLLKRMTGAVGMSAFTAALFAIHPLHVEPVAWISERKGLLSTMFGLLAIGAYVRYTRALSKRWLFAALLAYLASLMSKQMLVTLPFVLLLLDYWPLKRLTFGPADSCDPQTSTEAGKPPANATGSCAERLQSPAQPVRRLIWEKLPFFVVGFSFCVVAFAVQNAAGAVGTLDKYPLGVRLSNAVFSYGAYFAKTFIPTSLAVYYPHPGQAPPGGQILGAVLLLLAVSALAVFQRRKHPYLLVGWLWYLGTLLPVIGLVQIGTHQMAIRYTYVPILGLFIAVTWLVESLLPSGRRRRPLTILLVIVPIVACAVVSSQELTHWRSTQSLFTHALGVAEDNPLTRNHLGNVLAREGRPRDAIYHYQKALQIDPEDLDTHINYGVALYELGLWDAAIVHYQKALGISPDSAAAHNHLGNAEYARGRRDAAAHHYRTAFELDPNLAVPRNNLGNLLREEGRFAEAVESFLEALALQPYYVDAHNNLGLTYQAAGEFDKAIEHYREAIHIQPENVSAQVNLGTALQTQGQAGAAIAHYRSAVKSAPDHLIAWNNLGAALESLGRLEEAIECFRRALAIDSRFQPARDRLVEVHVAYARALARRGNFDAAASHLLQVLRIDARSALAHYELGVVLSRQGTWDDARRHFQEALRIQPEYPDARRRLDQIGNREPTRP